MSDSSSDASSPVCFVIFGASGDLAMRMLVPSLQTISCYKRLHEDSMIIGVARTAFKEDDLKERLASGIMQYARIRPDSDEPCETIPYFLNRFKYIQGDYGKEETYNKIRELVETRHFAGILYYMATPPSVVESVASNISKAGLNRLPNTWSRMIVEKPFGYDVATAVELNKILHAHFEESSIYRIDHYIAKETVMNMFTFRWGNALWEPLWNRNYISHVEIIVAESVDIGGRAGYYEKASVIRDMIQNHLLQIMAISAMEPPAIFNSKAIRDEKMKVFQAIRPITSNDVIYGQYQDYEKHQGIEAGSTTPTCAIVRIYIDNWRWQDVPFFLITGKSLNKKVSSIKLVFKKVPHQIFGANTVSRPNVLKMRLQPNEQIVLKQHVKTPGMGLNTKQIALKFSYSEQFGENSLQGAYERVILDSIRGDQSFFPRADEIETSWRVVEPLLRETYDVIHYAPGMDIRYGTLKRGCPCQSHQNWIPDPSEFVNGSAEMITRFITDSIDARGVCNVALSGGQTPRPIYSLLATLPFKTRIDFSKVHFFFVDERNVPQTHADSNYGMVNEMLFKHIDIPKENIHRMKGELPAEQAAEEYTKELEDYFQGEIIMDLIVLGMGPDGHIASLFPGTAAVFDRENAVVGHYVPQVDAMRITITQKVINVARLALVLIGDQKRKDRFLQAVQGPYCPGLLPAQLLRNHPTNVTWNIFG